MPDVCGPHARAYRAELWDRLNLIPSSNATASSMKQYPELYDAAPLAQSIGPAAKHRHKRHPAKRLPQFPSDFAPRGRGTVAWCGVRIVSTVLPRAKSANGFH